MKHWQISLAIIAALSASLVLADDFKTFNGKEYKNATVSRVEPDGIVVKFHGGIAKIFFVELPPEIQKKYGYDPEAEMQQKARAAELKARQDAAIPADTPASPPHTSAPASSATGCLDVATAQPALHNAAASMDAAIKAAKNGATATAASHISKAAANLRTAASAASADAAISHPLLRAAESYDKAAAEYARGDETGATLYATAADEFLKMSNAATQHSNVPNCR